MAYLFKGSREDVKNTLYYEVDKVQRLFFREKEIGEGFYPFTYNLTYETNHKALFYLFPDFF